MNGKYRSWLKYAAARGKWGMVRAVMGGMSSWEEIKAPELGYEMVIGCPGGLISILGANLEAVSRQDLTSCRRIICVVDWPLEELEAKWGKVEPNLKDRFSQLPLEFVYYTRLQAWVMRKLGYPAGYCWFSWQLGLGRVKTKYALLHDFDAFVLERGLLERRYREAVLSGVRWLGQRWYEGNGVERSDKLATTFEMFVDVEHVRRRYRPVDLFNKIDLFKGRSVEFDITLWCQAQEWMERNAEGVAAAVDMLEEEYVHPSQVVHQYTELTHKPGYVPPGKNRLPFVAYLLDLAGDEAILERAAEEVRDKGGFTLGGKWVDLGRTDAEHIEWLFKQARLVEEAWFGEVRERVANFFTAVLKRTGRVVEEKRARDVTTISPVIA